MLCIARSGSSLVVLSADAAGIDDQPDENASENGNDSEETALVESADGEIQVKEEQDSVLGGWVV